MMDARSLIKALGGSTQIAARIGSTRDAVRAWYRIGVPYRHWPAVRQLARELNVNGVDDAALAATKPAQAAA